MYKGMHASGALIAASLLVGCGSLTPALESGNGFYSDLPKSTVEGMIAAGKTKVSPLETVAMGCFAIAPESVDRKIIAPAVKAVMERRQAIAAGNVKASRQTGITVIDALLTGSFLWACSYWDVSGDLLIHDANNQKAASTGKAPTGPELPSEVP